ncbi:hypothetical protein [Microbispora amethystogenes]|uniref:Uncharacterized protein n=1 Tax=Microbispora amethystogenes TaxID=1427754 RepID=A0ABQ4FPU4_9ACTN|nr:hypothetical protein [Microbispora amethystogenes]GIH36840.1 hypothetical protein Mam01_70040 [Microbispora amethystogenes]
MLPVKPQRFLPFLFTVCALFFIVRDPVKAADAATAAFNGLLQVADALVTFASGLG